MIGRGNSAMVSLGVVASKGLRQGNEGARRKLKIRLDEESWERAVVREADLDVAAWLFVLASSE